MGMNEAQLLTVSGMLLIVAPPSQPQTDTRRSPTIAAITLTDNTDAHSDI